MNEQQTPQNQQNLLEQPLHDGQANYGDYAPVQTVEHSAEDTTPQDDGGHSLVLKVAAGAALVGVGAAAGFGAAEAIHRQDPTPAVSAPAPERSQPLILINPEQDMRTAQNEKAQHTKGELIASARTILADLGNPDSGSKVYAGDHEPAGTHASHWGNKAALIGKDRTVDTADDPFSGPEVHAAVQGDTLSLFEVKEVAEGQFESVDVTLTLEDANPAVKAVVERDLTPQDFIDALADPNLVSGGSAETQSPDGTRGSFSVSETGGSTASATNGHSEVVPTDLGAQIARLHTEMAELHNSARGRN
jgi:hypothetical protein